MEHLHALWLVASTAGEEPIELSARLFLVGRRPGTIEALRARLRRNERRQVDELACLERHKLVACLRGLQDPDG